jgi:hypothetical protein
VRQSSQSFYTISEYRDAFTAHACIGSLAHLVMAKPRRSRKVNTNQRGGYSGQSVAQSSRNNFAALAATDQYGECVCSASAA